MSIELVLRLTTFARNGIVKRIDRIFTICSGRSGPSGQISWIFMASNDTSSQWKYVDIQPFHCKDVPTVTQNKRSTAFNMQMVFLLVAQYLFPGYVTSNVARALLQL